MSISIPEIKLNDGMTVPAVGFGTYKLNGAAGVQAIVSAIDAGYRLIDSAFNYENEGAVGEARTAAHHFETPGAAPCL